MSNYEKIVCDVTILKKTSTKGNEFEGVYAILPNGKETFLTFDKKAYFILRKNQGKEN